MRVPCREMREGLPDGSMGRTRPPSDTSGDALHTHKGTRWCNLSQAMRDAMQKELGSNAPKSSVIPIGAVVAV